MNPISKFHTKDLKLRAAAAITTQMVRDAAAIHNASPVATMALGRVLTGAALLASMKARGQRVGVRFSGDGPLGEIYGDANFEGEVRGYCQHVQAVPPLSTDGGLDVASAVGRGNLSVTQAIPNQKEPQQGIVPIISGEISPDLAHYLKQSYQIPSVIALTVSLDEKGQVTHAGGVLVEVLPGASDAFLMELEKVASGAPGLSSVLSDEATPEDLVKGYVHNSELVEIEHPAKLRYHCPCSQERVERTLLLLGTAALSEMAIKGEVVPVRCEFCGKTYPMQAERIRELLLETKAEGPVH